MDMKIHVLTCEKNEVIQFGRDKFAWHKQASFLNFIQVPIYSSC